MGFLLLLAFLLCLVYPPAGLVVLIIAGIVGAASD